MKNIFKYALVFMGGLSAGVGICSIKVIVDDDFRNVLINKLVDKFRHRVYRHSVNYVETIVFEYRTAAEKAISELDSIIENYGFASVSDLYDICCVSKNAEYCDTQRGWFKTDNFKVVRTRGGYELRIPCPFPLY